MSHLRGTIALCVRLGLTILAICQSIECRDDDKTRKGQKKWPSPKMQEIGNRCEKDIFEHVSKKAEHCQLVVDENGFVRCTCTLKSGVVLQDFKCPGPYELGGRNFQQYLYSKNSSHRSCVYKLEDKSECEIEWQSNWRCVLRDNEDEYFQAVRKGILLDPPGANLRSGMRCFERYHGFTKCSQDGYCEQTIDRLCDLVSKHDKVFYETCSQLQDEINSQNCRAYKVSPPCTSHRFETIVCTPEITLSGQFQCHCVNPYKTMEKGGQVKRLTRDNCPISNEKKDSFWRAGWLSEMSDTDEDNATCIYSRLSFDKCDIRWLGKVKLQLTTGLGSHEYREHKFEPDDHISECTKEDKDHFNMLVGRLHQPHGHAGHFCDMAYDAKVTCDGLLCVGLCMPSGNVQDSLYEQEHKTCQALGSLQAKKLRDVTNTKHCWGCITKHDGSACLPVPADGLRRCKCHLLYYPDVFLQINNPTFFSFIEGWDNVGAVLVDDVLQPTKKLIYHGEGKRFVVHYKSDNWSFFFTHFQAVQNNEAEPMISWSEWNCEQPENQNWQIRHGNIKALGGKVGHANYGKSDQIWSCNGFECTQLHRNFIGCGPRRRESARECYCELDWNRTIPTLSSEPIICDAVYMGCCNPTGANDRRLGGYCRVEKGSCANSSVEKIIAREYEYKDDCKPLAKETHKCHQWWSHAKRKCPYGTALPGDITLPLRRSFSTLISVAYGYIPYFVAAGALLEFLIRRGTRSLSFILFVLFIVAMGELVFKKLPAFQQPRPALSCLQSCGMPSSHSALSIGYFVLMFADASWRQFTGGPGGGSTGSTETTESSFRPSQKITLIPILQADSTLTPERYTSWVGLWFCILCPVPITRVLLHDHTASQVMVGSLIGLFEALIWFAVMVQFEKRSKAHIGAQRFGVIHDLELTRYPVRPRDNASTSLSLRSFLPPSPSLFRSRNAPG